MKDYKTIKEFLDNVEEKREGLADVLCYCINKYEEETDMIIERIEIDEETGGLYIVDRLNSSSFGVKQK